MTILKYYSYIVIANVILNWLVAFNIINTGNRFVYSVLDFTYRMTEPFLNRIRALLPNFDMDYANVYGVLHKTNYIKYHEFDRRKKNCC